MSSRVGVLLIQVSFWLACAHPVRGLAGESEVRLHADHFRELEPMGWAAKTNAIPEWQEIQLNFREKEPLKLLFPAREIATIVTGRRSAESPRVILISFDQIEVEISRSTSYFSLIYNVRVALRVRGEAEPKWYFIAGFRGKRRVGYLRSPEAQQQIAVAIVDCLTGIGRTGGFRP